MSGFLLISIYQLEKIKDSEIIKFSMIKPVSTGRFIYCIITKTVGNQSVQSQNSFSIESLHFIKYPVILLDHLKNNFYCGYTKIYNVKMMCFFKVLMKKIFLIVSHSLIHSYIVFKVIKIRRNETNRCF